MMWRHGDILIAKTDKIPTNAKKRNNLILAYGEVTGHTHRIAERDAAQLFSMADLLFLQVVAEQATLIHEEHHPIVLPQGVYRVWQQREYTPKAIRRVVD